MSELETVEVLVEMVEWIGSELVSFSFEVELDEFGGGLGLDRVVGRGSDRLKSMGSVVKLECLGE